MLAKYSVQSNITFHYCYKFVHHSAGLQIVLLPFFRLVAMTEPLFAIWAVQVCCCRLSNIYSFLQKSLESTLEEGMSGIKRTKFHPALSLEVSVYCYCQ